MAATPGLRRLTGSVVATTVTALVLLGLSPAAGAADPTEPSADPPAPEVTSGTNGLIVTTLQHYDTNGLPTSAQLRASNGDSYFHRPDANARTNDPEYSPDGTELVYSAFGGAVSGQGIWVIANPFGHVSNFRQLTNSQYDTDPTWSPDGTKIAFIRTQSGDGGIWVIDADGGTPYQILSGSFFGEDLTWSPDGTKIAFADYSGNPFASPLHIYVMDVDGGTPVDLGVGSAPSWSPDGTRIAFQFPFSSTDTDIGVVNPDGTNRFGVIGETHHETEPTWSPDGTKLAFITPAGVVFSDIGSRTQTVAIPAISGATFEATTWGAVQRQCQGRPANVSGTPGNDTLRGSDGVDVIQGLGGNDTIIGLQGQDVICGGAGTDTVSYAGQTAPARATIGETDPWSGVSDLIAADVENLTGGAGPDQLVGDDGANTLLGGRGDDTTYAGGGADTVSGGGGDDTLVGDDGNDDLAGEGGEDVLRGGDGDDSLVGGDDSDRMVGGPGMDTVDYTGRIQPVNVTVGNGPGNDGGAADGGADDRDTVTGSVENLTGGNGADTLVGNDLNNQIRGNLGADTMRGGEGRDLIRARDGVADRVIDCGADVDAAPIRDDIDPAAISCS